MKAQRRFGWLLVALLVVGLSAGSVLAQDPENVPPQQYPNAGPSGPRQNAPYPPGRVARLQFTSGEVSMQPGGVNDWIAADLNRPLTTSDRVWTDKNARAELNVGNGFIRMNSETSLTLTNISNSTVRLELDQGVLVITVKYLENGQIYEIDAPNFAFMVMRTGVYRFDVRPNEDQSWVTVRSGYGEATGKGPAVRVNSGQQVRFSDGNSLLHATFSAPARDGFEDWAQVRDKRLDTSLSARYGVGFGPPGYVAGPPVCTYGYYGYAPYACAPYGYYGPSWFVGGVFIGTGPWYRGYWGRGGWGYYGGWGWGWGYGRGHYGRGFARGRVGGFRGSVGGGFYGGARGGFHGGGGRR